MPSHFDPLVSLLDNSLCTEEASTVATIDEPADTLTVAITATMLNISESFIYKLMDQGELAYEKRGRRKLPVTASVLEYRQRSLVPARKSAEPAKTSRRKEPYKFKYL